LRSVLFFLHSNGLLADVLATEWTIINKTLEANDKARPPAANVQPPPRVLPPVPAFPTPLPPPVSGPVASASRPTIKLKVNAQTKAVDTADQQTPKHRGRKPKTAEQNSTDAPAVDAPPPPYVDDGSHDILQEVLAIEREKDERRQRSTSEKAKDKSTITDAPPKRKKDDASVDEDDILALATPSKKERPSPPGPPPTVAKVKLVPQPTKPAPSVSKKAKKNRPAELPTASSDVQRMSAKGKEKEVVSNPVTPTQTPKPRKPSAATPINEKKCRDTLKALQKLPEAAIFARPVDPVLDGCPT
jgi:transcription initiation factor TFIID subunit 2